MHSYLYFDPQVLDSSFVSQAILDRLADDCRQVVEAALDTPRLTELVPVTELLPALLRLISHSQWQPDWGQVLLRAVQLVSQPSFAATDFSSEVLPVLLPLLLVSEDAQMQAAILRPECTSVDPLLKQIKTSLSKLPIHWVGECFNHLRFMFICSSESSPSKVKNVVPQNHASLKWLASALNKSNETLSLVSLLHQFHVSYHNLQKLIGCFSSARSTLF